MKTIRQKVEVYQIDFEQDVAIPVLPAKVKAGGYGSFESPVLDFPEDSIDLIKLLIRDRETTFFGVVTGDSMSSLGVFDKDLLIIQKGLMPQPNNTIVAYVQGEFYVKCFRPKFKQNSGALQSIELESKNEQYPNMFISDDDEFELWGVVTFNIHKLK